MLWINVQITSCKDDPFPLKTTSTYIFFISTKLSQPRIYLLQQVFLMLICITISED